MEIDSSALLPVLLLAAALAAVAWLVYRGELRGLPARVRRTLVLLRALAIALIACLLLEPAIVRVDETRRRGRIAVLLDRSSSFARADTEMDSGRRRRLAQSTGRDETEVVRQSRWRRALALLLDPGRGLLRRLASTHAIEVATFGADLEPSALPGELQARPEALDRSPDAAATDIAAALERAAAATGDSGAPGAVVLISDGRHTGDRPAEEAARALARWGIAVHAIAVGSAREPVDLAVADVLVPHPVHVEDRARGTARLRARVERETTFRVLVEAAGATADEREPGEEGAPPLWSGGVTVAASDETALVDVAFEIPAGALAPGRHELRVRVEAAPEEVTSTNNARAFLVDARARATDVLLVDGRPRWETRYLKNLFQRGDTVALEMVVAGAAAAAELPRGGGRTALPASREELDRFEVVVLGDLPRALLRDEELEWIRELVGERGGALVLIAGRRGRLAEYVDSPIGPLLPAAPEPAGAIDRAPGRRLSLTAAGRSRPELRLAADDGVNAELWTLLPPPAWVLGARPRPGAESWVELAAAEEDAGAGALPVVVFRRYGAGSVVHIGTDETWRWRFRAGDRWHARFWGQLIDAIRGDDLPAVGGVLALDTDRATYAQGERAAIRVRLREQAGELRSPPDAGRVVVELLRDGAAEHRVAVEPSASRPDVLEGLSPPLEAGRYTVRARLDPAPGAGDAAVAAVELPLLVEAPPAREELHASWDEGLLRRLAELSGGRFAREEDAGELVDALAPLSRIEVSEERLDLARSGWWFALIAALFTAEWLLRRRAGLV